MPCLIDVFVECQGVYTVFPSLCYKSMCSSISLSSEDLEIFHGAQSLLLTPVFLIKTARCPYNFFETPISVTSLPNIFCRL